MHLVGGHAVAEVSGDLGARADAKLSTADLDITTDNAIEDDRAARREDTFAHSPIDLDLPAEEIGVPRDDRRGIQYYVTAGDRRISITAAAR